jgi:exosortase K
MRPGRRATDPILIVVTLGIAWLAKDFYSEATFDDLLWLLAPTAGLVELVTGAGFELEAHQAYLSRELLFEIVPSCAGMNFLIAAFCSLAIGLVHTRRTVSGKLTFVMVSAVGAYGVTLLANTVRIVIAMRLHHAGISLGPLTPDRLHRIEGIAVYLLFLCATFWLAATVTGARHEPARS